MTPFFFGPPERQLFGVWHAGSEAIDRRIPVLMCYPFGQEGIRVHRLFRVLALRLGELGASTLRFDHYGSGDASGFDDEVELEGWRQDIILAHKELTVRSQATRVWWLAAGLGASAALLATQGRHDPDRLILWDPILDGKTYLNDLSLKHIAALESSLGLSPARPDITGIHTAVADEALGFRISPRLRDQLDGLRLCNAVPGDGVSIHVVSSQARVGIDDWVCSLRRMNIPVAHTTIGPFDWYIDQLNGAAFVPSAIVKTLQSLLVSSP